MSNGLTDLQKKEMRFLRHLVTEVKEFDLSKYKPLIEEYKKNDPEIAQILTDSKARADERYSDFLSSKVLKHGAIRALDVDFSILEESTVLQKVTGFLQQSTFNQMEYRKDFLDRSMVETTLERDKLLRENHRSLEKTFGRNIKDVGLDLSR